MEPKSVQARAVLADAGELEKRLTFARSIGNHRVDSYRLRQAILRTANRYYREKHMDRLFSESAVLPAPPPAWVGMPTTGPVNIFALLIEFNDVTHHNAQDTIHESLFGAPAHGVPYESLASYYERASYGHLDLRGGTTLGWYRTDKDRSDVLPTWRGREALIKEAIEHFDGQGHDFAQYDNTGDGQIDYFLVFWTGPHTGWGSFWWGYQTQFRGGGFAVDGVTLGAYSWQWECNPLQTRFNPRVAIHETGHALGLPDYYDYDEDIGPDGGVGDADMMDGNQLDHNCFSKWMLDWLEPTIVGRGSQRVTLDPTASHPDCVAVWPGLDSGDLFSEFFMVQNRQRVENDVDLPNEGLLIWHVDATLESDGEDFRYNNSDTEHKLLRLMEADGLEEIEANRAYDAGDFYTPGATFGPATTPNSNAYSGAKTFVEVSDIHADGREVSATISCASGFVVAWQDDRNQNREYQIMARGFRANGAERFADITVNSAGSGQQIDPALATDANGGFVVVWEDDRDLDGSYQIYARGFYGDGTERFHDMTVNSAGSGQQKNPAIAMDDDGNFVVVWQDDRDRNGRYEIYCRGFRADGTERFADLRVSPTGGGQQGMPAIAMNAEGDFVVVWQGDPDNDRFYEIMARGFRADGTERFAAKTVNSAGSGQQLIPAVAMDASGSFCVVWQDDRNGNGHYDVLARGFNANGTERFHDITVNSAGSGQQGVPSVAMDESGNFCVAWHDDQDQDNKFEIMARGFWADGTERFADITVNSVGSGQQLIPVIAMDDDGNFCVAWQDDRQQNRQYDILVRGFDADGTPRFADMTVNSAASGRQTRPAIAVI